MGTLYTFIGPVKSWHVFFPAALCSLLMICNIVFNDAEGIQFGKFKLSACKHAVLPAICLILLYAYSSNIYGNRPRPPFEKQRETSGIWAGIKVADSQDMQRNLWIEQTMKEPLLELEDCHTIAVSSSLRHVYLMTDKHPFVNSVENLTWKNALPYYEEFQDMPDALILAADDYNEESSAFIDNNYVCWKTFQNEDVDTTILIYVR